MVKILSRYDIQVSGEKDEMNLDFILNSNDKKIIHGTVWDDNLSSPQRVPDAIVQLYQAGENYNNDPLDIKPMGYVITDASGEFLAGPFDPEKIIIFKIFKFAENSKEYWDISLMISGEEFNLTSDE